MKVGERGQVTIPQALREAFGFLPETEVMFVVQDGALLLVKEGRQDELAKLYGRKQFERSTTELIKLLRE